MTDNNKTPLWLEIRKEYIDDNFEQLLTYMRECSLKKQNDSFYKTTIELIRDRVEELTNEISSRKVYQDHATESVTIFNVRLLATYLLAAPDDKFSLQAYVAMMGELQQLTPKFSSQILAVTFERLKYEKVENIGFSWNDIIDYKDEIFTYHAINNCKFSKPLTKPLTYENYGTAVLNSQGLLLTKENKKEAIKLQNSGANSLDTGLGLAVRTASYDKLKQSESSHISSMDEFVKGFVYDLWKTQKKSTPEHKLHYADDDDLIVRITNIEHNYTIHVESTDNKYEKISGVIYFSMPNFVYYAASLFPKYLKVGDYISVTLSNSEKRLFDISKQFIRFVTEDCREQYGTDELPAKLVYKNKNSLVWLNERGTHLYSKFTDDYQIGDYAYLQISEYCIGKEYGKIHTYMNDPVPEEDGIEIDEEETKRDTIRDFADSTPVPADIMKKEEYQDLSPVVLKLLVRHFYEYQKTLLKPSERYCFLANARIMAEMTDDELASSYIKFSSSYLRVLVQFASNESISNLTLEPEKEFADAQATLIRLAVVIILKEYGRTDNSEILAKTISDYEKKLPVLARIARLVQTANSLQGTLSDAAINVIRREIIKTLSIETENETDLEADGGEYLGIESGTQEFKTSFVYPSNNNMQPDEIAQNVNVARGVCAFLNSTTGGTLYLGVNDQGYVTGVENDMKFFKHQTIDAYMRHVQDTLMKLLGIDSLPYLRIESLYDNRVVAIHVEPHPYRVVELKGTAYMRVNAESREMPETVRQQLIARKVFKDRNKAAAVSLIQHAIETRRQVILHNYSSNHSGSVTDRTVEAYDVHPDDGLVMCLDTKDFVCKVFMISRIGYVEILEDKPWQYAHSHKDIKVDPFHMSGTDPIHVSWQMDLMAKNLLVEEFPSAKEYVTHDKNDENIWYFNGEVFNMYGVGRFYLGLASKIKILNAPELVEYARKFVKENIQL